MLDDIPDIGPARRKALMKKYQSLEAIREATEEDLAQTDSMSPQAARSVYRFFPGERTGKPAVRLVEDSMCLWYNLHKSKSHTKERKG